MRNISVIPVLPYKIPPIEDITDELPKHAEKVYPTRDLEQIDCITVHHMASEAPLMNQAAFHVNGRGWAGIGYQMVISDGRLYQCHDLTTQSNHSSGHNDHSIAISIRGDLSKRPLTPIERELLYSGILTLKYYIPSIKYIVGHNEQSKTSCPCISMNQVRQDIASLEEQMQFESQPNNRVADYFKAKERFADLYDKFVNKDKKWPTVVQAEAGRKLGIGYASLKENGFL